MLLAFFVQCLTLSHNRLWLGVLKRNHFYLGETTMVKASDRIRVNLKKIILIRRKSEMFQGKFRIVVKASTLKTFQTSGNHQISSHYTDINFFRENTRKTPGFSSWILSFLRETKNSLPICLGYWEDNQIGCHQARLLSNFYKFLLWWLVTTQRMNYFGRS